MIRMDLSLEKIREKLNNSPIHELKDTLNVYEEFLINELNKVSNPYRNTLIQITKIQKHIRNEEIANCKHDYERFCEYHNDRYFVCRICGHEKN